MKLSELIDNGAIAPEHLDIEIRGITADSRAVAPGYLFAALPGTRSNGADFAGDAVARGAVAILARADAHLNLGKAVPVIADANPHRRLALIAARFYRAQPRVVAAVTGTNGKTSVAAFVRQIWEAMGLKAASLGTVGAVSPAGARPLDHTTPDPVSLHRILADLKAEGVEHLALEASSHGLDQHRLDGVAIAAAAFTNITRDHLDYHKSFEAYFAAKLRLFTELAQPGAPAVIHAGQIEALDVAAAAHDRGLRVFTVGRLGRDLKLVDAERDGFAQRLKLRFGGKTHQVLLPLAGEFQTANALVAAGLVLSLGAEPQHVFPALAALKGARGRMELAAHAENGAPIFIDYAHTPDALHKALETLRPYAKGRLAVIFGCGGDRDRGKRAQMGAVAVALADRVIVTDDNPRSEDPAAIRREILSSAPGALEIGDRAAAIRAAIAALEAGDVLLIAGKGHETGQIVGGKTLPYSDHAAVAAALGRDFGQDFGQELGDGIWGAPAAAGSAEEAPAPVMTGAAETEAAPQGEVKAAPSPEPAAPADQPAPAAAEAGSKLPPPASAPVLSEDAVAMPGPLPSESTEPAAAVPEPAATAAAPPDQANAPLWTLQAVLAATKGSAQGQPPEGASGVSIDSRTLKRGDIFVAIKGERGDGHDHVGSALDKGAAFAIVSRDYFGAAGPLIRVPDTLGALNALAMAARARCEGRIAAITGSVGKTSSKEMLRLALGASGATHASEKSYNNLWGVPLSLARMPGETRFGVFEIGMNHAGEITPLTRMVRPHLAIVTTVAAVHIEFFDSVEGIAEAKAEIFNGLEPGGTAILNADNEYFALLRARARERGAERIITFGAGADADARLIAAQSEDEATAIEADIMGERVAFRLGAPGRHLALNAVAVLAAVKALGADLAGAAAALAAFEPPEGRGVRQTLVLAGGPVILIDESYNANPASMRAALAALGETPVGPGGRRIAVLGDMLELGNASQEMHLDLKPAIDEAKVDVVFACGQFMRELHDALPADRRGGHADAASDLAETVVRAVAPGDVVMVKGSLGSRMGVVVGALRDHLKALAARDESGRETAGKT
jgi:UDP-N-acetylmuramyl-tripeptide synthetase/UDP-N-acetylmuramoyl-tripeptide--D-alanyl-D-alanine ligase